MLSEAITKEWIDIDSSDVTHVVSSFDIRAEAAKSVITLAFSTDPIARWTYPDPDQYLEYFPWFINAFAGRAFENGTAYLAPDFAGAALWLTPGVGPDEDELLGLVWESTSSEVQKDLFPMFEQMAAFHPTYPHWYLPMIGVEPSRRGSGVGSALLQHSLANCDAEGLPAYMESSSPKNIPLYERFGFELIGTIRSGDAPPMFPMLRKPQRTWDDEILKTQS
ncbi:MAG: GNAT family N-acetyltransferase [bacterium]|nr:GNAT family N-acetyltransferase [bacterium]